MYCNMNGCHDRVSLCIIWSNDMYVAVTGFTPITLATAIKFSFGGLTEVSASVLLSSDATSTRVKVPVPNMGAYSGPMDVKVISGGSS